METQTRLRSKQKIITLLTDFGLMDPYVAEMKATILTLCPDAKIIDISHLVRKFDVKMGAYILAQAAPYFPDGTVHVVVVDPGVGTERRPIIVQAERSFYVGPDNGVLMLSAKREGIKKIYEIKNPKYMLPKVSRTFHGRDIFSPTAAYLVMGVPPKCFGPEVIDPIIPSFAEPSVYEDRVSGEVIHVDNFGNLITNISTEALEKAEIREGDMITVQIGDKLLKVKFCRAYGEVSPGKLLAVIGGGGLLEFSVNLGNAKEALNCDVGVKITVSH
ncbi:hypothetical protein CW702_00500 [Candidatus Bathyarchaeota archaeon]|nr:MAG: hypothetical protein CW702_00500 [Candidatus Bathyarchaeota archaeon]